MSATLYGNVKLRVRGDFGAGLVDITGFFKDAEGLVVSRGKDDEQWHAEPAQLSGTVENDGRFTPDRRDSPYWPGVKLRAPIVFDVSFNGGSSWVDRMTGGIDDYGQSFPDGTGDIVFTDLKASGVVRQYGQGAKAAGGAMARQVAAMGPAGYWKIEEPSGAAQAGNDIDPTEPLIPTDPELVDFGSVDGTAGMGGRGASIDTLGYLSGAFRATPLTVEMLCAPTDNDTILTLFCVDSAGNFDTVVMRGFNVPFVGEFQAFYGVLSVISAAATPLPGGWYHVVVTITIAGGSSALKLYVQGELLDTDTGTLVTPAGYAMQLTAVDGIAHVAVYDRVLSAGEIADNFQAAAGWVGETAGDRHNRICGEESIPTNGSTAPTRMGAQPNAPIVEVLEDGAKAEWGNLVETAGGELDLAPRTDRYTDVPVFTVAAGDDPGIVVSVAPLLNDLGVCNIGTASRPGGSSVTVEDADRSQQPPDGEGRYPKGIDVNIEGDVELPDYAGWLNATGVPTERYPDLILQFKAEHAAELEDWCGLELGALIEVTNLPDAATPTIRGFLEFTEETWRSDMVTVRATLSSVYPWSNVFTIADADLGRLGLDGQTVNSNASAGATSLSVATASGKPKLSTAAGDYPLDLKVDGRKVHVTAASGASSPQTLTVSALTAALTAGMEVDLWTEPVLAL